MNIETVSKEELEEYGYTCDGMIAVTKPTALELFDSNFSEVYLLYSDNTEGQALIRADIEEHDGYFGI